MKNRLFLPWSLLVGLFFLTSNAEAARATTLILGKSKPEPKIDTPPTAEEESVPVSVPATSNLSNETINVGNVTKLTGVPQIDYIYDPNLPRELNGYNLTDYPFYNSVPEDIDFKCDGLHDGFYASVPHKCQVYHHCLFGTRYDFLCANYTAFDQKTFICHFASEVDCKNSPRYFNRNEALYKATTTTTVSPFGSSGSARRPQLDSPGGRRRRPYRRRKPSYEYYDEYEDLSEDDYYDEASSRRRKRPRPSGGRDSYDDAEEEGSEGEKQLPPSGPNKSVFDRPRIAPKIRRPVPVNERDKYDYSSDSRAIVKEPAVEKKRFEDSESTRKQNTNKAPDFYEPTAGGNSKNKEPDTEREREREHKGGDYDSDRERERERERERDRDRERDERPFRRPPKKRRRPDGLDDEYDEYDDVRRYRNRNRPRYEEYDDYEYDERPYRRNRDPEYRPRDHDYDRDRPYRGRESDYDRPRNRDRVRDDDRPIRNRDIDDRPVRTRDDDRPLRSRDEDRPIRIRDTEKPIPKDQDDRLFRNRNEQSYRNDAKSNKNRNRDDDRHYYSGDDDRYRDRSSEENKRSKETYRDEPSGVNKEEDTDRPYKYKDEDTYGKQNPQDDADKYRDRNRNQERPLRFRDNADKFGKGRNPSRDEPEEAKTRVPEVSYNNGRLRPGDQTRNNERGPARPGNVQRPRVPQTSSEEDVTSSEDQSKPVPASRPAYITKPTEAPQRKPFGDQNGRKQNSFKRPLLPRVPTVTEDSPQPSDTFRPSLPPEEPPLIQNNGRYEDRQTYERPSYEVENTEQQPPKYNPPEDIRGTIQQLNEKLQPVKPEEQPQVDLSQPRLKVPHEDSVPKEELAPRAPKFPQTSSRRRPFLPSRNGNANLPRNLLPVGVKALQTPRGFQAPNKEPEKEQQQPVTVPYQEKDKQEQPRYQFPPSTGGVEFRAKLSAAIGVDQPKLTQFFQDVQSSSELELPEYENPQNPSLSGVDADYYSTGPQTQEEERPSGQDPIPFPRVPQRQPSNQNTQDLSSSHNIPEYSSGQQFRQENNPSINFRPTLKPTDFPQLSVPDAPPSQHAQPQENRNLEQALKNRPLPSAINQQFTSKPILYPPPAPKPAPPQPQLGLQSFYSENPKFQTTIKVPEPFPYKPTPPNTNFNAGTHLPVFQGGLRPNLPNSKPEQVRYENGQRQIDVPQESFKPLNLKFPSQNENLDDTDEYDVSLNDALQPISTLHPRNVPTGVFLSNWQRNQQPAAFKRRVFQGPPPPARQQNDSQEYNNRKQELPPRVTAESRIVPNQQKNQKFNTQRQSSSNIYQRYVHPPVYHPLRPVTNPGNYFAIITQ